MSAANSIFVIAVLSACAARAAVSYDVRAFGTKGDGVTKDTVPFQRALDACARTGGTVKVPPGIYLIGSVFLGDDTELRLAEGATLLGSPDLSDYNDPDAYPQNYGCPDEGWSAKHLIIAVERRNVAISGKGVIDGNGRSFFADEKTYWGKIGWRRGGIASRGDPSEMRRPGQEIVFIECTGVSVRDVTLRDMACWSCFFHGCRDVVVGGVTVRNGLCNLNTDAFDVDSCRNVKIGDCDIVTGDDAIAIRGSPSRLKDVSKVCENVRVSNIVCQVSAAGVRVGVGNGTIRDVRISNMCIKESGRGLHVQCCYGTPNGGGKAGVDISDIVFENVSIRDTCEPICVHAGSDVSTARLGDIAFRGIQSSAFSRVSVEGSGATRPTGIRFEDCTFRICAPPVDSAPKEEDLSDSVQRDGAAFRIARADGVSFSNCSLFWDDDAPSWLEFAFAALDAPTPVSDGRCSLLGRAEFCAAETKTVDRKRQTKEKQ